ncbi:MAG: hypothetical protein H6709_19710 [Kofleriaceae bacterium]|nr:hypothetical protein [Myxococcales bacterium]MCB9559601.1 hypothetical protein [Kofleriaceae bacterium]MCB9574314.1 hypothetical protein [Kofleriaceae bacterium]
MDATSPDRRKHRSDNPHIALTLQLDACCDEGLAAMVLADGDGLPMASSGDDYACEEVAGRMVIVARRIRDFAGTLLGSGQRWDVQMTKFEVEGSELVLCAVGGSAEARSRQLARSLRGVSRILGAPAPA